MLAPSSVAKTPRAGSVAWLQAALNHLVDIVVVPV